MKIFVAGTRGIPNIMGGIETHCEKLFPELVRQFSDVDVTVIRRRHYAHADGLKEWKGVKLYDVRSPKKKSLEAIVHTYRAIVRARRQKADLIHIHAVGPALLIPFARLLGLRVVFTHHGPDYDRDKWGRLATFVLKLGERLGTKYATEVIVISNVINAILMRKYGRVDSHLIYNGVDEPQFCTDEAYMQELGIAPRKYILSMCRFVPEKNLHHLVEAFSRINNNGYKLVLAGDTDFEDDYSRSLKAKAKAAGVVLPGFIKGEKLRTLLSNASCYVLPSSHEGLPIALLEAMSYKLPVVVSNIPANLEVGLPGECYFQLGEVDELAQKLQQVVDVPFSERTYDLSKYQWSTIARQVYDVYRKALTK